MRVTVTLSGFAIEGRDNPTTCMEPWRTAIVDAGPDHIRVRGHDVLDLMQQATFTDLIYLLHHQRAADVSRASSDRRAS